MIFYNLIILILIKEQQNKGISAQTEQCSLTTSIKLQNEQLYDKRGRPLQRINSYSIKNQIHDKLTLLNITLIF